MQTMAIERQQQQKQQQQQQLFIKVPSLFRCPISLEVMKSPVSLHTGVTYDRSSIQHWLESGHDTCPATNQPLPSKDFVPNLTLHRLINIWLQSSSSSPSTRLNVPTRDQITESIQTISRATQTTTTTTDTRVLACLEQILVFSSHCQENRRFLCGFKGFLETILGVLRRDNNIKESEVGVRILGSILSENGVNEKLHGLILGSKFQGSCFDSIMVILQNGTQASKLESVRLLESVAINNESKRAIADKESMLSLLFQIIKTSEADSNLRNAVLSLMMALSSLRSVKTLLISLGIIPALSRIISDSKTDSSAMEKSIKLIHAMCSLAEGRQAISEDPQCAVALMGRLMRPAMEEAVGVLWSMCCVHRDVRVKERVVRNNGLAKVLLVMQSEGDDGHVRKMCGELVKVLRGMCKEGDRGLLCYESKTSHIRPC